MNCITYSINRKMGLYLMVASTVIGTLLIGYFAPILAIFVFIFGFMHCRREYRNQKYAAVGMTWMCTQDFLNKPFPLNQKQIWKVAAIWLASFLTLGIFCLSLYHSSFSNMSLLISNITATPIGPR